MDVCNCLCAQCLSASIVLREKGREKRRERKREREREREREIDTEKDKNKKEEETRHLRREQYHGAHTHRQLHTSLNALTVTHIQGI